MKRGLLALFVVALALPAAAGIGVAPTARAAEKPNIVFFVVDDLDTRSLAYMPNVQSLLADRGTTLSNFIYNVALCCPSRATMLRGQYAHNTRVYTHRPAHGGFETFYRRGLENSTTAVWLQKAGYRTALIGKYLNGYPQRNNRETVPATYVPPGWSEWHVPFGRSEDVPYFGFNYTMNDNGVLSRRLDTADDYLTDVLTSRAMDFLATESDAPFFLNLTPLAPHDPAVPAPRHLGLFPGLTYPRTPSFNESDVSDKPAWVRQQSPIDPGLVPLFPGDPTSVNSHYRHRLQSLQAVDEMVAQVVTKLEDTGELDNTYIFFGSDNGYHMGEHRMVPGKESPYEEDIKVPMIVTGPGVPAGSTVGNLVGNVDIAPTFAEIGGATPETQIDGRSLMPLLGGASVPVTAGRQVYLLQHLGAEDRLIPSFRGLRSLTFTFVEYENGEGELYNLARDPFQLNNLYSTTDPHTLSILSQRLHQLRRCAADECRTIDSQPPPTL